MAGFNLPVVALCLLGVAAVYVSAQADTTLVTGKSYLILSVEGTLVTANEGGSREKGTSKITTEDGGEDKIQNQQWELIPSYAVLPEEKGHLWRFKSRSATNGHNNLVYNQPVGNFYPYWQSWLIREQTGGEGSGKFRIQSQDRTMCLENVGYNLPAEKRPCVENNPNQYWEFVPYEA